MAKRVTSVTTITPTATADASTPLANATYPFCLQGSGTSTFTRTAIIEVYLGGQATASAPTYMVVGMNSTAGAGSNSYGAGQNDAPMDAATAALSGITVVGNTWATTSPQRSTSLKLLNLSFNAFGGIVRWVAAPGEEIMVVGAAVNTGSLSVSAFTGGTPGALGAHMVYETS